MKEPAAHIGEVQILCGTLPVNDIEGWLKMGGIYQTAVLWAHFTDHCHVSFVSRNIQNYMDMI